MLKLIKDKNVQLKIFRKEKDLRVYQYFLPKVQEFLFSSFGFSEAKKKKLEELPIETKKQQFWQNILVQFLNIICHVMFMEQTDENCIFFKIRKLEIICFNTGICFLLIKTSLDSTNEFTDLLNFNYRFRDIQKKMNE